jgi:hypothetical protein
MGSPTVESFEGPGTVSVNGRVLADATKLSVKISTNDNDVLTMRKGWAGTSDGAMTTDITIDSAVPRKGMEADYIQLITARKPVSMTVKLAGKRITATGKFRDLDATQDVSSPANMQVSFKGGQPQVRG